MSNRYLLLGCIAAAALAAAVAPPFTPSSLAQASDGSGLKTSAAVDMGGAFNVSKDDDGDEAGAAPDRFDIREAEILLTAPIDQIFDGLLSAAAHREDGVSVFEVHEAVISSSKLIPRSRLRVGQFFLGIGRLNQVHRHEWPFIDAPKVQAEFFGAEGALDSGGEYAYLLPLPFFLEITAGVTNGWTYGHSHDAGEKPRQPTHYGRIATYFGLFGGGAQTGLNYLSRTTATGDRMVLAGADFTGKWRAGGVLNFLLQGEAWQRTLRPAGGDAERARGLYVLPQYALTTVLQFGVLLDYFTRPDLRDITGAKVRNEEWRVVPTLTYKASEFSSLRLAYDWTSATQAGQPERKNQSVAVQATFMMGAHPAHDF